jgi:hypothetical protein
MIDDMKGGDMVTCECTSVKSRRNVKQSKYIIQALEKIARTNFMKRKRPLNVGQPYGNFHGLSGRPNKPQKTVDIRLGVLHNVGQEVYHAVQYAS